MNGVGALMTAAATQPKHIMFIVGDDVGYNDLGVTNGGRTHTPRLDELYSSGVALKSYYTFKICSPSRAAMLTGRYPWGAGFYDMSADTNHCTKQFTALPQMLKSAGYATHALGKWDVGFLQSECSPTGRGFDSFFGYYMACQADYWYHGASGGYPPQCNMPGEETHGFGTGLPTDFSNSTASRISPAATALNGTYNTRLLGAEAVRLVMAHDTSSPLYMYLAFMAVHDGCFNLKSNLGKQAPLATVERYASTTNDTYKVAGAMYTELDEQVGKVVDALKARGMWESTALIFVSDNGGPLDHTTNAPLRGGKHTFLEGGVRVTAFIAGPLVPPARRGGEWWGMAASADWYHTLVEGIAGSKVPRDTGPRPPDGFDLWDSILSGEAGPRKEVVHQVHNQYICDKTHGASCSSSIRMGEMKLIVGDPGDSRTIAWPQPASTPVPFGRSGGVIEPGTDHARAPGIGGATFELTCDPFCLFNLTADLGEQHDLAAVSSLAPLAQRMLARLEFHGSTGPPPSYLWPNLTTWHAKVEHLCARSEASGYAEPLDSTTSTVEQQLGVGKREVWLDEWLDGAPW